MAHRKDGCDYESQDDRQGRDSSIAVKRTPGIIHPTSQPGQSGQMSALIKCHKPTIASTAPPTIPMERIDDILLEMRQMLERMQLMVRKVEDQAQYLRPVQVSLPSASAWIPLTPPTPETTSLDIDSSSKNDFRTPAEVQHDSRIIQSSGIYNWDREDAYG
ncbi:hypothetical protein H257_05854 [Aphanomyces astaci]|uniref:Uncharacterized protein n=1 Tax=Aphanomyces astaci TaxID=112090 RepID=W4GQK1_APHAT|nr:hypothetical protein H257_05854 [Aphanomyces astaci]ETV81294.1 hypothetical protein H257_05854 [Aphanomyces astaci]|eukprot:XP_009829152.1 hypothetical protein H257_05854 [Aphanomyces astaci]